MNDASSREPGAVHLQRVRDLLRQGLSAQAHAELVCELDHLSPRSRTHLWVALANLMPSRTRLDVRGVTMRMTTTSSMEKYRAAAASDKEPETLDWIDETFAGDQVLYDVGANVGTYTIYAAVRNPKGRVVAFEPAAANVAALCANIQANRLRNVTLCTCALGESQALGAFRLSSLESGSSMHSLDCRDVQEFGEEVVLEHAVAVTTIDEVRRQLPAPTLIKIDVDGREADVVEGAVQTLQAPSVTSVLLELNWADGEPRTDVLARLEAFGFRQTHCGLEHWRGDRHWRNYIFRRESAV